MNTTDVKKTNTLKVFQLVYNERIISKLHIAQTLGISQPTIAQCVNELKSAGLLRDDYRYESSVGRKAAGIMSLPNCRVAIGVEVHKHYIRMVAINIYGEILFENQAELAYENDEKYYSLLGNAINNFFISCNITKDILLGVSIAVQGLPDRTGNKMIYGTILDNKNFTLDGLKPYVLFPSILRHDTEALADYTLWNHPEIQDCCFLAIDINMGGTIIIDRSAHWGSIMPSGLVEHMVIVPGGKQCYCGKKGCAETYCSSVSLLEGTGENLDSFFQKMRSGHADYCSRWNEFLQHLAFLLDNIQMVFSTEIVIGGRLANYITEEDMQKLDNLLDRNFYQDIHRPGVILSHYNDIAVGAALYYVNQFLAQPIRYDS